MARRAPAAEFIEENELLVPLILGDMVEHLGRAGQAWSNAVWARETVTSTRRSRTWSR
jgi:hypothetical protein